MKIGSLIKANRTKLGMTQNELANGICSIPHLSKIENNNKEANEETIRLLLERLNIQLQSVIESEAFIQQDLLELEEHIFYVDHEKCKEVYTRLLTRESLIAYTDYLYRYELLKLRYFIFIYDYNQLDEQIIWLNNNKNNFSQYERYLLTYFYALSLMIRGRFAEANVHFNELLSQPIDFERFEGEFYYHVSVAKSRLNENGQAIIYGRKALELFKDQFNFKRISFTLMALGLSYSQDEIFDEALVLLKHAMRNAIYLQQTDILPNIYQYISFIYENKGEYNEVLNYLTLSLALLKEDNPQYKGNLFNRAFILFKLTNNEESKLQFEKLKNLSSKSEPFYHLSNFYLLLLDGDKKEAMKYLEERVLAIMEKSHDMKPLYLFLVKTLREYYLTNQQYEKALKYSIE